LTSDIASAARRCRNARRFHLSRAVLLLATLNGALAAAQDARPPTIIEPDPQPRIELPDESGYSASPQDGGGSVTVTPTAVTARQPCTLTFVYTTGAAGIRAGGGVLCYVTRFWYWTPPQSASPEQPGYSTVACSSADVTLAITVDPYSQTILAKVETGALKPGDQLTFTYGDTSGGRFPEASGGADRYAEREERFFFKVDGDGDGWFTPVAEQPRFDVRAGEAARVVALGPSRAPVGEPFEMRLSVLDAANNVAEGFTGDIQLTFDPTALEAPETVRIGAADRGSVAVRVVPRRVDVTQLIASSSDARFAPANSNTLVFYEPNPQRFQLYWADLQIHGNLSDGTGIPADIYRYARDVARLDVAALTEHDHWGYLPLDDNRRAWQRILRTTEKCNDPGRFVTFPAYEWTNWTFGHQHVLFRYAKDAAVHAWCDPATDHPRKLWAALRGVDCVTVPHHTGGEPIPTCWKYHDPTFQPVVELVSIHGVSERLGQPGCISGPVKSGMVQSALARGYRLGFLGGGDTHDGHPGLGSPGMYPPGLAGIWATELTRDAIFAAIRARRVYATSGNRAILRFHSGAVPMGGSIKLDQADTPRELQVAVVGDAPIAGITIVKNNNDVASFEASDFVVTRSWTDTSPARNGDYYYARIAQTDGGWIWSSPIWVELR
jgi:hypothetical protein